MPKATVDGGGSDYRVQYTEPPEMAWTWEDTPEHQAAAELTRLDDETGTESATRPNQNHPKDAWVAYAVAQGTDPDTAAAMSKKDLIAQHS